eukprot:Sro779_g201230.1 n/a (1134) ;mRNA; f:3900-7301
MATGVASRSLSPPPTSDATNKNQPAKYDPFNDPKLETKQKTLTLLTHAANCQVSPSDCANKQCKAAKTMLQHIVKCKDPKCKAPFCPFAKFVLRHGPQIKKASDEKAAKRKNMVVGGQVQKPNPKRFRHYYRRKRLRPTVTTPSPQARGFQSICNQLNDAQQQGHPLSKKKRAKQKRKSMPLIQESKKEDKYANNNDQDDDEESSSGSEFSDTSTELQSQSSSSEEESSEEESSSDSEEDETLERHVVNNQGSFLKTMQKQRKRLRRGSLSSGNRRGSDTSSSQGDNNEDIDASPFQTPLPKRLPPRSPARGGTNTTRAIPSRRKMPHLGARSPPRSAVARAFKDRGPRMPSRSDVTDSDNSSISSSSSDDENDNKEDEESDSEWSSEKPKPSKLAQARKAARTKAVSSSGGDGETSDSSSSEEEESSDEEENKGEKTRGKVSAKASQVAKPTRDDSSSSSSSSSDEENDNKQTSKKANAKTLAAQTKVSDSHSSSEEEEVQEPQWFGFAADKTKKQIRDDSSSSEEEDEESTASAKKPQEKAYDSDSGSEEEEGGQTRGKGSSPAKLSQPIARATDDSSSEEEEDDSTTTDKVAKATTTKDAASQDREESDSSSSEDSASEEEKEPDTNAPKPAQSAGDDSSTSSTSEDDRDEISGQVEGGTKPCERKNPVDDLEKAESDQSSRASSSPSEDEDDETSEKHLQTADESEKNMPMADKSSSSSKSEPSRDEEQSTENRDSQTPTRPKDKTEYADHAKALAAAPGDVGWHGLEVDPTTSAPALDAADDNGLNKGEVEEQRRSKDTPRDDDNAESNVWVPPDVVGLVAKNAKRLESIDTSAPDFSADDEEQPKGPDWVDVEANNGNGTNVDPENDATQSSSTAPIRLPEEVTTGKSDAVTDDDSQNPKPLNAPILNKTGRERMSFRSKISMFAPSSEESPSPAFASTSKPPPMWPPPKDVNISSLIADVNQRVDTEQRKGQMHKETITKAPATESKWKDFKANSPANFSGPVTATTSETPEALPDQSQGESGPQKAKLAPVSLERSSTPNDVTGTEEKDESDLTALGNSQRSIADSRTRGVEATAESSDTDSNSQDSNAAQQEMKEKAPNSTDAAAKSIGSDGAVSDVKSQTALKH